MLGLHVQWAGTGPRNPFEKNGLLERVEGLAGSRMRGGLAQGEGTRPGWGPPGVHVWELWRESSKAHISGQEQAREERHGLAGRARVVLSNEGAMALWGLGMVAG